MLLPIVPDNAVLLLAFFIASVVPDMDSKNSLVRKTASMLIPSVVAFLVAVNVNTNAEARVASGLVTLFAAHVIIQALPASHRGRKSLHRIPVMILLPVFIGSSVWFVFGSPELWKVVAASFLGCVSHMTADKLLKRG